MNSTNNNSFEIAAKKVFSDLYNLIKENENITTEIDDKPIESNLLDLKKMNVSAFLFVLVSRMKKLKYLKLLIKIVLLKLLVNIIKI